MDALLFVDTNILLDFYRVRGHGPGLALLDRLVEHGDKVITGNQVEMEYTKNRQRVILQSLEHLLALEVDEFWTPAFVAELTSLQVMQKRWQELKHQYIKVQRSIERLLQQPAKHDAIYQKVQTLFTHGVRSHTSKEAKVLGRIRRFAWQRFTMGYPPRKAGDTSIGDAINWEWIIDCTTACQKDLILVSRDTDYGTPFGNPPVLNDWLAQEFNARCPGRTIVLTDSLAYAFKLIAIPVTTDEEDEERTLTARR